MKLDLPTSARKQGQLDKISDELKQFDEKI